MSAFYLRASSLGSYFGVGFNDPEEQYAIDTGAKEVVFDDDAKARMELGTKFEETILDYFETKLGVIIDERNEETLHIYGGKIHGRMDGKGLYNGEPTVFEAKMSNSKSKRFVDSKGYEIQVHCYMMDDPNVTQAMLLGLQNGQPTFKVIRRNESMIRDIKEMTDFILGVHAGENSWDDYPWHLVDKYSDSASLKPMENITEDQTRMAQEIAELSDNIKALEAEKKALEKEFKKNLGVGKYSDASIEFSYREQSRRGGIDIDRLIMDYPDLDVDMYRKEDSRFKVLRIKQK